MTDPNTVVWSLGGTGTALRDCSLLDDDGVFEATTWVTVLYLPLWPLRRARYRLLDRRRRALLHRRLRLEHLALLPMPRAGLFQTAVLAWVITPIALFAPTALLSLPWLLAGRLQAAAIGAALSSFWMIPLGLGLTIYTLGQPWPRPPPGAVWPAFATELRRAAALTTAAGLLTTTLVGGSCGGLRVAIELSDGHSPTEALGGGLENAAFLGVLCALVIPLLWLRIAWLRARAAEG